MPKPENIRHLWPAVEMLFSSQVVCHVIILCLSSCTHCTLSHLPNCLMTVNAEDDSIYMTRNLQRHNGIFICDSWKSAVCVRAMTGKYIEVEVGVLIVISRNNHADRIILNTDWGSSDELCTYSLQCPTIKTRSIFSQILTTGTP